MNNTLFFQMHVFQQVDLKDLGNKKQQPTTAGCEPAA